MNIRIESKVAHLFYEKDIQVNCVNRPRFRDSFGSKRIVHGLEVPKKDVDEVMDELNRKGIIFKIQEGKFLNIRGFWTHKSYNFLEVPNHEKAYAMLVGDSQ